jgi:hypothetical protein
VAIPSRPSGSTARLTARRNRDGGRPVRQQGPLPTSASARITLTPHREAHVSIPCFPPTVGSTLGGGSHVGSEPRTTAFLLIHRAERRSVAGRQPLVRRCSLPRGKLGQAESRILLIDLTKPGIFRLEGWPEPVQANERREMTAPHNSSIQPPFPVSPSPSGRRGCGSGLIPPSIKSEVGGGHPFDALAHAADAGAQPDQRRRPVRLADLGPARAPLLDLDQQRGELRADGQRAALPVVDVVADASGVGRSDSREDMTAPAAWTLPSLVPSEGRTVSV